MREENKIHIIELVLAILVGVIIGMMLYIFLSCDYTDYKCLEGGECQNEGEMRRYPKYSEGCPECLECIDNIWVEMDCEDFPLEKENNIKNSTI